MDQEQIEAQAKKDGWAPKEDWKGPEDQWKTAEQFVADGEKIQSVLKNKVEHLEGRVEELLATNKSFNEFTQRSLKKELAEKADLIKELETLKAKAITEGDGDAVLDAERKIESLKEPPEKPPELTPVQQGWLADNDWYNKNEDLTIFADGIADKLVQQGYTDQSPLYFEELSKRVKKRFPEEFVNKNRNKDNAVEDATDIVDSKERTFANLPKEAKKEFEAFKRDIPGFTKEAYAAQYDWSE